jgi:hypothetical protein
VHEALIRNWPNLVDWVNRDRAFIGWRNQLRQRLGEWRASPRYEGTLLRGGPLAVAEEWVSRRGYEEFSQEEMLFVTQSSEAEKFRKDQVCSHHGPVARWD